MKPKNRIYCASSGKSKLLFATEKKALTYLKFNYDEILQENGIAPIRAYYCECCMGWHTTHIMEGSHIEQRIEKEWTEYEELEKWRAEQNAKRKAIEAEEKKKHKLHNDAIYNKIVELIEQARLQHIANATPQAVKSLTEALEMLANVKKFSGLNLKKFTTKRKEIEYLLTLYKHD